MDIVFEVDRAKMAATELEATDAQRAVIPLINGTSDVQEIVDASGLVEFEVGKALYELFMAGFINRVGRSIAATPALPEGRIEEHRNLGIAFFKTGMLDEALREFRRVLELRSNDPMARFHLGLVYARQKKWDDALTAFTAAAVIPGAKAPVFHNLSYVLEQMQRYEDARRALEEAVRRGGGTDPRVHTSLGVVCLLAGDLPGAETGLAAARKWFGDRSPTPAWYHYAALAAALAGDVRRASVLLQEGTAAYFRVPRCC
jgi:Flp pilus assembly protein TadD